MRAEAVWRGMSTRPWWPLARRTLGILFILVVLVLLLKLGQRIDWSAAMAAMRQLPPATLAAAAALAATSHGLYGCYELVGRHVTRHGLPRRTVLAVGLVSYAFNLNLGALIGGVAFRFRLYAQRGLGNGVITQVLALSVLTNWLGYLCVGALVLLLVPPPSPPGWPIGSAGSVQVLGGALLLVVGAYLLVCAHPRLRRPGWSVRGHAWQPPSGRVALWQLALSSLNWLLIAGVLFVLLQQRVEYPTVLAVLLLAAVAGVVTHVPAGLGVIEAVFLLCLAGRLPAAELLGALLAYRVIYYLVPLAGASALLLGMRLARSAGAVLAPR
jgi:uncharacterized membrane protein YbhN (UPF0104 family)